MSENRCLEILSLLQDEMRLWGKHVDEFSETYIRLNAAERAALSKGTDVEVKYGFLCQVLAHAHRELDRSDDDTQRKILNWCFTVLIFENFDFDYRENIRRLIALFEATKSFSGVQLQVWSSLENIASEKVVSYLTTVKGSPTSTIE